MKPYSFLTRANRRNLLKLAEYLERLSPRYRHFEMRFFFDTTEVEEEVEYNYALRNGGVDACGTVACAVGHGPSAGILCPRTLTEVTEYSWGKSYDVDWSRYTDRFFINGFHGAMSNDEPAILFQFMFGEDWSGVDNHHYGAAARIRYILAGEPLPEGWTRWSDPDEETVKLYKRFRKPANGRAWTPPELVA